MGAYQDILDALDKSFGNCGYECLTYPEYNESDQAISVIGFAHDTDEATAFAREVMEWALDDLGLYADFDVACVVFGRAVNHDDPDLKEIGITYRIFN